MWGLGFGVSGFLGFAVRVEGCGVFYGFGVSGRVSQRAFITAGA